MAHRFDALSSDVCKIDVLLREHQAGTLGVREPAQVFGQSHEALGLAVHRVEVVALVGEDAVLGGLDPREQPADRGAQFVREVSGRFTSHRVLTVERGGETIERSRQLLHLRSSTSLNAG